MNGWYVSSDSSSNTVIITWFSSMSTVNRQSTNRNCRQRKKHRMPHGYGFGDIGRSGPWSSARVVVLQSTIVRRTHCCAMTSAQSGVLFIIIGKFCVFLYLATGAPQSASSHINLIQYNSTHQSFDTILMQDHSQIKSVVTHFVDSGLFLNMR